MLKRYVLNLSSLFQASYQWILVQELLFPEMFRLKPISA